MRTDHSTYEARPAGETPRAGSDASDTNLETRRQIEQDLLLLFARNQLKVFLAMPVLALLQSIAIYTWTDALIAGSWFCSYLAAQAVQLYLCFLFETSRRARTHTGEWLGMLCASETLIAVCWILSLFVYWEDGNQPQHIFLMAMSMAVIAVRIMMAGNVLPIILSGTGLLALAAVVRCLMQPDLLYIFLGSVVLMAEIFLIQLVRRLQGTAHEMLVFKAEREALIGKLDGALAEAENARARAEQANQAKSRFLATMSHELRTPLNAILGFSEILSKEMMGPHAVPVYKSYSDDIHYSGDYLLKLINDILDLSRIEADRHEIDNEPIDPCEIGRECVDLLAMQSARKSQRFDYAFEDAALRINGDERAVRQIWLNLLSNAIKFSPPESTIRLFTRQLPNGAAVIGVADNGPGLPADELADAQRAFVRGTNARHKATEGAGLGLSIVKGLAELHEAQMQIRPSSEGGLEVSVEFPARRVLGTVRAELADASQTMPASQRKLIELTA